ncbi:MAG: ComEC/Rec2 family competence protein [Eubacterium sp.]|nr:ComEC/Rec2 family competence protein [Eubacterium sp.]
MALLLTLTKIITKKQGRFFVMIFLCCCIGFINMDRSILQKKNVEQYCEDYAGQNSSVQGTVKKITETAYGYNVILSEVKVGSVFADRFLVFQKEEPKVSMGQRVLATGTVELISPARNFGNFDGKEYYCSLEIYGKLNASSLMGRGSGDVIRETIRKRKDEFRKVLRKICPDCEWLYKGKAKIYDAMLLGEKSELSETVKTLYSSSGIAHILAISSLHISLVGMLLYRLLRRRFRFGISSSVSIVIVVAFGLLSGMSISAIRAIIMFGLKLLGDVLGRKYDVLTAISLSAWLLLLENPFLIFHSGFQMSFIAIIGIVPVWNLLQSCWEIKQKWLKTLVGAINIHIMMVPLIAYYYCEIPTYSVLLNLIIVPLMGVVIASGISGILLGSVISYLGKLAITPGCICLSLFSKLCEGVVYLPKSIIIVGRPEQWKIWLYYLCYVGGIFLIKIHMERRRKQWDEQKKIVTKEGKDLLRELEEEQKEKYWYRRWKVVVVVVMMVTQYLIYWKGSAGFYMTFLDVGQGDGIFIHTDSDVNILMDGGSTSVEEVGKRRITPFLKAKGIREIDYAVISHSDLDHINGLMELLEASDKNGVRVNCLVLPCLKNPDEAYEKLELLARMRQVGVKYIRQGEKWTVGDFTLQCVYPKGTEMLDDKNDLSTVLSITYQKFSALLTGDISSEVERQLELPLQKYTILKVAHHGSVYSSCQEFLENVKPLISVISVGEQNLYGHPSPKSLERLRKSGTKIYRTDESGAVTVECDGQELEIETHLKK